MHSKLVCQIIIRSFLNNFSVTCDLAPAILGFLWEFTAQDAAQLVLEKTLDDIEPFDFYGLIANCDLSAVKKIRRVGDGITISNNGLYAVLNSCLTPPQIWSFVDNRIIWTSTDATDVFKFTADETACVQCVDSTIHHISLSDLKETTYDVSTRLRGNMFCMDVSPDGTHCVLCNDWGDIGILNLESDTITKIQPHEFMQYALRSVCYSPNGKFIAISYYVEHWKTHMYHIEIKQWSPAHDGFFICFLSNQSYILQNAHVYVYNMDGTKLKTQLANSNLRFVKMRDEVLYMVDYDMKCTMHRLKSI